MFEIDEPPSYRYYYWNILRLAQDDQADDV